MEDSTLKCMVYNGQSMYYMDDLGVLLSLRKPPYMTDMRENRMDKWIYNGIHHGVSTI